MSDALRDLVDSIGREAFGASWLVYRGSVREYFVKNPVKVARWRAEVRQAVEEGRL